MAYYRGSPDHHECQADRLPRAPEALLPLPAGKRRRKTSACLISGDESSITDFLVLATGTSEPHLRALRVELEQVLKDRGPGWSARDGRAQRLDGRRRL